MRIRLRRLRSALRFTAAFLWRRLMRRTTFIAITGSVGKTTAKDCLAGILSSRFCIAHTLRNENLFRDLARSILRVRPRHRFAVLEVATDRPGCMRHMARLLRPDIAVVLCVARTHTREFKTLEATAAEKAVLLEWLRPGGIAILNGDDERVAAMAPPPGRSVLRFGSRPEFDFQGEEASSSWPDRFQFRFTSNGASYPVRTRLVGTHWMPAMLGALAAASACGMPAREAVEAIGRVEPTPARLQPAALPCGATVLRDEESDSIDTVHAALRVLKDARAARKVLVFSDVSNGEKNRRRQADELGREAARIAQAAIFVGECAGRSAAAASRAGLQEVQGFLRPEDAAAYLAQSTRAGDLVLLKGRFTDHLSRIFFAQFGAVTSWIPSCSKLTICDDCGECLTKSAKVIAAGANQSYEK